MSPLQYITDPQNFNNWQALYDLLKQGFAPMEGRIDPPSSLNKLTPELLCEKAKVETLVIVQDGEQLAACVFLKPLEDAYYVGKLAVGDRYRGQGIARKLIELAENVARKDSKDWLELQVRVELAENHATFAALDFVKTGETAHAGYNRPTSITMRKRVG